MLFTSHVANFQRQPLWQLLRTHVASDCTLTFKIHRQDRQEGNEWHGQPGQRGKEASPKAILALCEEHGKDESTCPVVSDKTPT